MDLEQDDYEILRENENFEYPKGALTYGSMIYLTYNDDGVNEYYAFAEGFNKTKIILKSTQQFKKESAYLRGLFKIYPSFYNNEYKKAKQKFEKYNMAKKNALFDMQSRETRLEIPKLLKALEEEQALNFDVYEKLKGTPVRFGQVIQLLHVNSQKYITYDPDQISDYESDCLKVELKYEASENSCFRILSSFKYQQENQGYIFDQDLVYLVSTTDISQKMIGEPYLHASKSMAESKIKKAEKKEINISTDKKSQWKINIFSDFIDDKKGFLSIGDIIWINLSEEDKNLMVKGSHSNQDYHFFSFASCSSTEKFQKFVGNSNGLFIIESLNMETGGLVKWDKDYRIKHLTTNKYIKIDYNGNQKEEELIEKNENLSSMLTLTTEEEEATHFRFDIIYSTISSRNKKLHVRFLQKDAYFRLKAVSSLSDDNANPNNDNNVKISNNINNTSNNNPNNPNNIKQSKLWLTYQDVKREELYAYDPDIETDYITIPLLGDKKEDNVFHLSRANQNEVLITLFLISCKKTLQNCLKYLSPAFIDYSSNTNIQTKYKILVYKLDRMKKCLQQLEHFCKNKLFEYLTSDQSYGTTHNRFIQNVLREQLFIELLIRALLESFPQYKDLEDLKMTENTRAIKKQKMKRESQDIIDIFPKEKDSPRRNSMTKESDDSAALSMLNDLKEELNHKKKKICESIYKLISSICSNNRANEVYIGKYLPIFQLQAEYITSAVDTINSIINDNEELLLNLHKASDKKNLIDMFANKETIYRLPSNFQFTDDDLNISEHYSNDFEIEAAPKRNLKKGAKNKPKPHDLKKTLWNRYYDKILNFLDKDITQLFKDWNTIKFFVSILKNSANNDLNQKILDFFHTIAVMKGQGINVNQEDAYKYFTEVDRTGQTLFEQYSYKFISKLPQESNKNSNDNERELELYVISKRKEQPYTLANLLNKMHDDIDPSLSFISFTELPSERNEESILNTKTKENMGEQIICNHLDLFSSMCTSRNYSWKLFVEKQIKFYALLNAMNNEVLSPKLKAAICELLKSLYVDQEPRRLRETPLLCKTLDIEKIKQKAQGKASNLAKYLTHDGSKTMDNDYIEEIEELKKQVRKFISTAEENVKKLPEEYKKDDQINITNKLKREQAFNDFTYSLVKLINLMLKFNVIYIEPKKLFVEGFDKKKGIVFKNQGAKKHKTMGLLSKEEYHNKEFKDIFRALTQIFRYNFTYPETEKIIKYIIKVRKEKIDLVLRTKKFLGKTLDLLTNATDLLKLDLRKAETTKMKKKKQNIDFLLQDVTGNEIYLKQSEVMKKILQSLLTYQQNQIESSIKYEILCMIEYLFDCKQDELLNNMKSIFLKFCQDTKVIESLTNHKLKLRSIHSMIDDKLLDYMNYILPNILRTGTEVDDIDEKLKESIDKIDIIDIYEFLGYDILPILFQEFCLNYNKQVENKLIELIIKIYSQREIFINNAKDLLVLFDSNNIEVYNRVQQNLADLEAYCSESEIWLTTDYINYDKLESTTNLITLYYNLLFIEDNNNNNSKSNANNNKNNISLNGSINISNNNNNNMSINNNLDLLRLKKDEIDSMKQNMFRNLKIYIPIINLIRDNMHIFETYYTDDIKTKLLFQSCLYFLIAFVKDNQVNQELICNYINVLYYNINANIGQVQLICEIFKNNPKLCYTKHHEVLPHMVKLIYKHGRKTEYLEFFHIIQNIETDLLYNTRKLILDTFLDPNNKIKLLYMKNKDEFEFNKVLEADEPYYYHAKLLKILAKTAVGKEGLILNELRLRGAIDFSYLVNLLCNPDSYSTTEEGLYELGEPPLKGYDVIKIPILKFIYYVYLESEKMSDELSKYNEKFIRYVKIETARIKDHQSFKKIFVSYFFKNFLFVTKSFFKMVKIDDKSQDEETKKLEELKNLAEAIMASKFFKDNMDKIPHSGLSSLVEILDLLGLSHSIDLMEAQKKSPDIDDLQKSKVKMDTEQDSPKNLETEENAWKAVWDTFLKKFLNSEYLKKAVAHEKKILAKALLKIEEPYSKDRTLKEIINKEEIIKKLINIAASDEVIEKTPQLTIQILGVLGDIIEVEEDEKKKNESIKDQQNFLNKNGATVMLFTKLSSPDLPKPIFMQMIKFGIKLLDGGNNEVQKSIYKFFTNYPNSEIFFKRIHDKITREIQNVKKSTEDQEAKFTSELMESADNILKILRLLQLFAEGHYRELQNYIRQQTNSYHNYDILGNIIDLLTAYMQNKNSNYFDNIVQSFDTITEFIQGPCLENQVAIIQGSFLNMASSLFLIDERIEDLSYKKDKKSNKYLKNNRLMRWQVSRIKYKCSITLISLLEGRKDNDIVFRMLKSFQVDIIKRNIYDIYNVFMEQYDGLYHDKIFGHFDHSPEDKDKNDQYYTEDHCAFIIETGFNLFFLLNHFMEINSDTQVEDEELEIVENNNLLTNNIVSRLGKFGFNIIVDIIKRITCVGCATAKKLTAKKKIKLYEENDDTKVIDEEKIKIELDKERAEKFKDAFDFFKKNSAHVEILTENTLEKTYFYILPFCHSLTKDTKKKFHQEVNRISVKSKVSSLLQKSNELIETIEHEYKLNLWFNKIKILAALTKNILMWRDAAFLLAIAINIIVLISYKKVNDETVNPYTENVIFILGLILIFLSLFIVVYFLLKTAPLLVKKAWIGVEKKKISIADYMFRIIMTVIYLISDFFTLYYSIYGVTAVFGLTISPYFFAYHLFDIIVRYPTLANVVKSIWTPRKSLFLTLLLFLLLQYTFTLFGYYWIADDYHGYCKNTLTCFLAAIDKSFKTDGALGGFLNNTDDSLLRFFFDNLFYFILIIIMLNIILGIIIDTFGKLRDEESKFNHDIQNICFICGKDRETIDKVSGSKGFQYHIKNDHYLWYYLFYIAYIKKKISTEYTGIESFVADKIEKEEISWLPTHRALLFNDDEEDDSNKVIKALKEIEKEQMELKKYSNTLTKNINYLENTIKTQQLRKEINLQNIRSL